MPTSVYDCEAQDSALNGEGEVTYSDSRVYRGTFAQGLPDGAGELILPDGDVLSGTWHRGKPHGVMTLKSSDRVSVVAFAHGVAPES